MKALTARGKVSENAKLVLELHASFKGETVEVTYEVKRIESERPSKEEWTRYVNSVYGCITDPAFERPPQPEMPPAPRFDE